MANKREFKKYVEAVGASACEAMMATYYNVEDADKEAIIKSMEQLLGAVGAAQSNANVTFDKGVKAFGDIKEYSKAKKDFYKKLFIKINEDFSKELDAALKVFNAAIPQEVKEQYKKYIAQ
ncbi:MAG: hypothetical protein K2I16_05265 [Muribaculaceae bacterium]|nr:hypothetical protein [Muribaculaceae bacterium]